MRQCQIRVDQLLDDPFMLEFNDPVNARYYVTGENGLQTPVNDQEEKKVALIRYPVPDYVTDKAVFGDPESDYNRMWLLPEMTPE